MTLLSVLIISILIVKLRLCLTCLCLSLNWAWIVCITSIFHCIFHSLILEIILKQNVLVDKYNKNVVYQWCCVIYLTLKTILVFCLLPRNFVDTIVNHVYLFPGFAFNENVITNLKFRCHLSYEWARLINTGPVLGVDAVSGCTWGYLLSGLHP